MGGQALCKAVFALLLSLSAYDARWSRLLGKIHRGSVCFIANKTIRESEREITLLRPALIFLAPSLQASI